MCCLLNELLLLVIHKEELKQSHTLEIKCRYHSYTEKQYFIKTEKMLVCCLLKELELLEINKEGLKQNHTVSSNRIYICKLTKQKLGEVNR